MHTPTIQNAPGEFAAMVQPVVQTLRSALSGVIAVIPGFTYTRPNDLAVSWGLDPKVAWNLGRCLQASDHYAAAQFVPGPAGIRAFLRAAKRLNASADAIEKARMAFKAFQEVVRTYAGSRKRFNMLAAGMASTNRVRSDIEHRRLLFDGNSYLWGVQARTIFRTCIVLPAEGGEFLDVVSIRGFIDFCLLRPNIAWRITQSLSVDGNHNIHSDVRSLALDPGYDGSLPLLNVFCSQPTPRFRSVIGPLGVSEFEIVENTIGNPARSNFVTAELLPHVEPSRRNALYSDFCVSYAIRTPARNLIFDLLLHRSTFSINRPITAELYGDLFGGGPALRYSDSNRLPLSESPTFLGSGTDTAFTPEIPRYPDMLRYAVRQIGLDGAEFDLYRLRMHYPPLPTTLMLRTPLPETS